eukprot:TRINITY_DN3875_c0_g1_i1.p1 TRINITY_DN3875_c0_g1~~TRINITY_DN3875_c0_g1_i1.p1  ORF type:complete len:302 (+),score=55.89 TRINITY_DN3875_c0_g1_i1:68-973(+)
MSGSAESADNKESTCVEPTSHFVDCLSKLGFHRVHYLQYGRADNPHVVVCCHGLTRNCWDFDTVARALSTQYRVVCVDVVGRGGSQWLADHTLYGYAQYLSDMCVLLARLNAEQLYWIGSSMGGLIGMMLAAQSGTPIRKLVMNDIGAVVPASALSRIGTYVGLDPRFESLQQVQQDLVCRYGDQFGPHMTENHWKTLAEHGAFLDPQCQQYRLAYDPKIGDAFRQAVTGADIDLWTIYDKVSCPLLLLRGANSDVIEAGTAEAMTQRGPRASLITYPEVGHHPMLITPQEIEHIVTFFSN